MRLALLPLAFALLAPPAPAQDATRHAWGNPLSDLGPSVPSVAPCAFPCVAVVRFDNTLVANGSGALVLVGAGRDLLAHEATLALDGVPIAVVVEQGDQRVPDVLRVTPPQGYKVEPGELVVDDDRRGSVRGARAGGPGRARLRHRIRSPGQPLARPRGPAGGAEPFLFFAPRDGAAKQSLLTSVASPPARRRLPTMRIAPENRWLYPIDWPQLSALIRFGRPKGRCERCGRPHGAEVTHLGDGTWWDAEREVWRDGRGRRMRGPPPPQVIEAGQPSLAGIPAAALLPTTRVVLASCHLEHDPGHNKGRNLAAPCQRCHMLHDGPEHRQTRW